MRSIALIVLLLLCISGTASALGIMPAGQVAKNISVATVTTTQQPANNDIIGNLIGPIVRVVPVATATPSVQQTTVPPVQPQPAPSVMTLVSKFEDLQIHGASAASPANACSPGSSSLRVMHGKIKLVYANDQPKELWGAVLYENDGNAYTLLSDNEHIYSMMETAIIMDRDIGLAGYPVAGNPDDGFSVLLPSYKVCWMDVSRM